MTEEKKRLTIGVLVSGIMDDVTKYVCRGALQEARSADVNVVIVPGKYWERDLSDNSDLMYEYQHNTAFSYVVKGNVDALVIAAGSIGCYTSKERMEALLKKYEDIPCVLIASKMEGYVSVNFDNYQGIKEGLETLIDNGCKRFGMIGGSLENSDAYERKQAFEEVLSSRGIHVVDEMYVEGDFSRRCTAAYRKLLDDNPDLEAVFCVNDETALGFYEELSRRGLRAGKDISVLGYDDTFAATKASPSLSSVRADSRKLGEEAFKMAVEMAKGNAVESRVIPTGFVKRDSFVGAKEEFGVSALNGKDSRFEDIFYRYCYDETKEQMKMLKDCYYNLIEQISEKFTAVRNKNISEIVRCMDTFIELGGIRYADVDNLLAAMEKLYRELRDRQTDETGKSELWGIFSAFYRKVIQSMNRQFGKMKETEDLNNYAMKLFVQGMLRFERGRDQSYGVLLENLNWLNVKNACIYMLPKPVLHLFKEDFNPPEEVYMKAVLMGNEVNTISVHGQKQNIDSIFAALSACGADRQELVLLPLFFKETVYGALLCDMTDEVPANGELLINQISSAIKMITLLQENEEIQQQLEENLVTLKEYNIKLDTISKSDVLTGILNRRGFYKEAERQAVKSRNEGKAIYVIYIDMNNLKIINDRYGHKEGDHSLKLIGQFLESFAENRGVAGRIGGDEYACIIECEDGYDENAMLLELYGMFEQYNATSEKPYNVTVSAGSYVLEPEDTLTIKEALMQADEKMYEVKKLRKKDVAKITGLNDLV